MLAQISLDLWCFIGIIKKYADDATMNFELCAVAHAHMHTIGAKVTAYSGYSSRIIRNLFGALIKEHLNSENYIVAL